MTLSDRISSGDISQEVVEAVAVALGWYQGGAYPGLPTYYWRNTDDAHAPERHTGCPNYPADIRLTLYEASSRGLPVHIEANISSAMVKVGEARVVRKDADLALAAITALLRALGE